MKQLIVLFIILSGPLTAQVPVLERPSEPPVVADEAEPRILGVTQGEFKLAQGALADGFASDPVKALTMQIEQLIQQRDELMFTKAVELHPELKSQLATVSAKMKDVQKSKKPPEPPVKG